MGMAHVSLFETTMQSLQCCRPLARNLRAADVLLLLGGLALAFLLWLLASPGVQANGATVTEVYRGQEGAYQVVVRAIAPRLVRGNAHLSIIVQEAASQRLVSDAVVSVLAQGPDGATTGPVETYHEIATPLYYDVNLPLGALGLWRFTVSVVGLQGEAELRFPLEVEDPVVSWGAVGGLLALVLLALPLAVVGLRAMRRGKKDPALLKGRG